MKKILLLFVLLLTSCRIFERNSMSTVEFEPNLEEPYAASEIYGIGYEGYSNREIPSQIKLLGWMKGAYTSTSNYNKLIYLGEPKILIRNREGKGYLIPLEWVGDPPPKEFRGKITIKIFELDTGYINWNEERVSNWDFQP